MIQVGSILVPARADEWPNLNSIGPVHRHARQVWSYGAGGSWRSRNTGIARGIPSCSSTDSSALITRHRMWPSKPPARACGSSPRTGPVWDGSEFVARRSALDAVDDVEDLAAALELDEFSLIGISGGTPYALAALYRLGRRIRTVTILSGMGPMQLPGALHGMDQRRRLFLGAGSRYPQLARRGFQAAADRFRADPDRFLHRLVTTWSIPDQHCSSGETSSTCS